MNLLALLSVPLFSALAYRPYDRLVGSNPTVGQIPTDQGSAPLGFQEYQPAFRQIIGENPRIDLALENNGYPFAHEAGVYFSASEELFVTSNRLTTESGTQYIQISRITNKNGTLLQEEINPNIPMANGGVKYKDGVLFCSQGTMDQPAGLMYMEHTAPYNTEMVIDSFYGRPLNSPNDVVVHPDGSIWFTDPVYGHDQGFRPSPQLPGQVYRFDPKSKSIRVVADGMGRPNGIAFSPHGDIAYITDTDRIRADNNPSRVATIYAFDVVHYDGQPFLTNRRVHAMSDSGVPDGIKCDAEGNVYSGCGDGIHVWSKGGMLLGKILIPGGVANFVFTGSGEIFALNEEKLWKIHLAPQTRVLPPSPRGVVG